MSMDRNQVKSAVFTYLYHDNFLPRAKRELVEIKKLVDFKDKRERANVAWKEHSEFSQLVQSHYKNYDLREINLNDIVEYESIVNELLNIAVSEVPKNPVSNLGESRENKYTCEYCKQSKLGQYWYRTFEGRQPVAMGREQQKFCSRECLNSWNKNQNQDSGDSNQNITCQECKKVFRGVSYGWYDEKGNKDYKFCSKECSNNYIDKKIEVATSLKVLASEAGNIEVPNFPTIAELEQKSQAGQLQTYLQQKLTEIRQIRSNKSNGKDNNSKRERERERERETNLLQYFTTKNIHSVRLDNHKLFIKYIHKAEEEEEEEEEPNTTELEQIRDYLDSIPEKSITKSELESKNRQNSSANGNGDKDSNLGLYISLGVVGVFLISLLLIFARIRKRKNIKIIWKEIQYKTEKT